MPEISRPEGAKSAAVTGTSMRGEEDSSADDGRAAARLIRHLSPDLEDASALALRSGLWLVQLGPVLVLVVLWIVMSSLSEFFITEGNLVNLGVQTSVIGALAIGQLIVIVTRGIDLSVGSVLSLATVTGGLAYDTATLSSGLPVAATMILTGAAVGLVNGLIYVKGKVPHPFIVTLAMFYAARGLALVLTDGGSLPGMPPLVQDAGSGFAGRIPIPVVLVATVGLVVFVFMRWTRWGRWIYAVGDNPDGALRAGIPVTRVLVSAYVLCGMGAGLAGLITAGRTNSGFPTAGNLMELDAIAAVMIGGASFFGGRGNVANALVGALILATIRNGMNLLGVSAYWQLLVIGLVILVAVELDVLRTRIVDRLRMKAAKE